LFDYLFKYLGNISIFFNIIYSNFYGIYKTNLFFIFDIFSYYLYKNWALLNKHFLSIYKSIIYRFDIV